MLKCQCSYFIHNLRSELQKSILPIFQLDSISERIHQFSQIAKKGIQQKDFIPHSYSYYPKLTPSYFQNCTAKQLHEFHRINKTMVNAKIIHALAHIQFNAFLAYADTYFRFGFSTELWPNDNEQSEEFKSDMMKIALDQGSHCLMLMNRLQQLGLPYGSMPVISNLTSTIQKTNGNVLSRFALISIVHEGRGIRSIDRLINKVGDKKSMDILKLIKNQQLFHLTAGKKWFQHFASRSSQPLAIQIEQINQQYKTNIKETDIYH